MTPEERKALDKRVLAQLLLNPVPASDLCKQLGLDWKEDGVELRGSLLRLQQAGKADIAYGLGWFKKP